MHFKTRNEKFLWVENYIIPILYGSNVVLLQKPMYKELTFQKPVYLRKKISNIVLTIPKSSFYIHICKKMNFKCHENHVICTNDWK